MWNWIQKLHELHALGRPFAVVTVARCSGSTPRETGAKMLVTSGQFFGTIGGGQLEQTAIQEARRCLETGKPAVIDYPLHASVNQCCGGVVQMMYEPVNTGPELQIFGAGHVGQALVRTLDGTPFRTRLIDERPEWSPTPTAPVAFAEEHEWSSVRSCAAIMTHEHDLDYEILKVLLKKPLKYLGLIGSETKWKSFQLRLKKDGFSEDDIARVRCPMGIALGGKSPQEVAISIAAELLRLHHGV